MAVEFDWSAGFLKVRTIADNGGKYEWWGSRIRAIGVVTDPNDEEGAADLIEQLLDWKEKYPAK